MFNPLDYVSSDDIISLGLTPFDIETAYQPSTGGVFHCRGAEGTGKTLWIAHFYRHLIDSGIFTPRDAVGNITFKGKYANGFTIKKGEELHQYLWDLTHKPYTHKIVVIDEIDSEFPARFFTSHEQTEIALRMWHVQKLGNFILMSSHIGNSTDLIFHLASHYLILPEKPNFGTQTMDFTLINNLELWTDSFVANDVVKTMLIYNRQELTESNDYDKIKPTKKPQPLKLGVEAEPDFELDTELELRNFS